MSDLAQELGKLTGLQLGAVGTVAVVLGWHGIRQAVGLIKWLVARTNGRTTRPEIGEPAWVGKLCARGHDLEKTMDAIALKTDTVERKVSAIAKLHDATDASGMPRTWCSAAAQAKEFGRLADELRETNASLRTLIELIKARRS